VIAALGAGPVPAGFGQLLAAVLSAEIDELVTGQVYRADQVIAAHWGCGLSYSFDRWKLADARRRRVQAQLRRTERRAARRRNP
jgi:hypothetical protein